MLMPHQLLSQLPGGSCHHHSMDSIGPHPTRRAHSLNGMSLDIAKGTSPAAAPARRRCRKVVDNLPSYGIMHTRAHSQTPQHETCHFSFHWYLSALPIASLVQRVCLLSGNMAACLYHALQLLLQVDAACRESGASLLCQLAALINIYQHSNMPLHHAQLSLMNTGTAY